MLISVFLYVCEKEIKLIFLLGFQLCALEFYLQFELTVNLIIFSKNITILLLVWVNFFWKLENGSWAPKNWCFWTVVLEKTLESPLDCKEIQSVLPKDQSWVFIGRTDVESWNFNTLATWCEELTYLKRPWCWERLRAGGEGDDRGWDGWMASLTQWTWVWVDSGRWRWTGRPGMLWFMGSQSRTWLSDWTELNWYMCIFYIFIF